MFTKTKTQWPCLHTSMMTTPTLNPPAGTQTLSNYDTSAPFGNQSYLTSWNTANPWTCGIPAVCSTMPVAIQLANPCGYSVLQKNYPDIFLLGLFSNHAAKSNCLYKRISLPLPREGVNFINDSMWPHFKLSFHV